jgi:hypothetical protein
LTLVDIANWQVDNTQHTSRHMAPSAFCTLASNSKKNKPAERRKAEADADAASPRTAPREQEQTPSTQHPK